MDIGDYFAPESMADTDHPRELGKIMWDSTRFTPDEVRVFASQLLSLADVAERALTDDPEPVVHPCATQRKP